MRIVAGRWAGRDLTSPGGRVRPTAEEVRDAALGWVAPHLDGARILDLCAGSGALGLEALSRGARTADFVERNRSAMHALKANVARFRATKRTRIFAHDAVDFLAHPALAAYDVALADPPYEHALAERIAARWLDAPFSAVLVVEHAPDREMPRPGAGSGVRMARRTRGHAGLTRYIAPGPPSTSPDSDSASNSRRR
jgi:16S rRNA (guanine966-N2)-methyltransferase